MAYADGGLYLTAYVPEYRQVRVFAMERVRRVTVLAKGFTPGADLAADAFEGSLGVNRGGKPETIVIEFTPRVAPYVREREWHASQRIEATSDGGVRVTLKVCRDWALRTWVLGWGGHAHVVAPATLAAEILAQLNEARDGYVPRLVLDPAPATRPAAHPTLPLRS